LLEQEAKNSGSKQRDNILKIVFIKPPRNYPFGQGARKLDPRRSKLEWAHKKNPPKFLTADRKSVDAFRS